MKTMKRMISLALSLLMLTALCACGAQPATSEQESAKPAAKVETLATPVYPAERSFDAVDVAGLDAFTAESLPVVFAGLNGDNRVYSPLNVYMALAMLAEITDGETRAQLLDTLGCPDIETLRAGIAQLFAASYADEEMLTVLPAASVWLRDGYDYKSDALQRLAEDYYAAAFCGTMGDAAYTQALRDWVNEQTHELLKAQADQLELNADTVLALVTTLYFKGRWGSKFPADRTEKDVFHADSGEVDADFMHTSKVTAYYRGERFGAIRLSMYGGAGMWIVLPDEGTTLQELIDSGEVGAFLADPEAAENRQATVYITLPRFDVSSDLDLIGTLQALGVEDAFDLTKSDFSPLTDEALFVSDVEHAARVKIDEEGCEAAAFTAMMYASGMMLPPDETIDFVCDRPFFFAVTGSQGQIFFTGAVNQP